MLPQLVQQGVFPPVGQMMEGIGGVNTVKLAVFQHIRRSLQPTADQFRPRGVLRCRRQHPFRKIHRRHRVAGLRKPGSQPSGAAAQVQGGDALPGVDDVEYLLLQLGVAGERVLPRCLAGGHVGVIIRLPGVKPGGVHCLVFHQLSSISSSARPFSTVTRPNAPLMRVKQGFTWPISASSARGRSPSARRTACS